MNPFKRNLDGFRDWIREGWKRPKPNPDDSKDPVDEAKDIFIEHLPTPEQTNGIDQFFVRVCAQVATEVYRKEASELSQFDTLAKINIEDTGLKEKPKAVIYDSSGDFNATNPPFLAVVAGDKLVMGWRGSSNMMDAVRDVSIYLGSSSCWKNLAKVVKVHAGSLACVEDSMVVHEAEVLKIIDDYQIKEILLTGHSLGGGIAQVAQLWFQGTMNEEIDPTPNKWKELAKEGLTVKCMSFEGMSTTVYVESDDKELNQKGIDFINQCGANMCTTAFSVDVVPMCIGRVEDFGMKFVHNVIDKLPNQAKNPLREGGYKMVLGLVTNIIDKPVEELTDVYFPIAGRYQHIGKVLYYASPTAAPKVYIENTNGILVDKQGKKPSLPEIGELDYKDAEDPIAALMFNHMFIVTGPGLAFSRREDAVFKSYPE